jgi:hypothetical protein
MAKIKISPGAETGQVLAVARSVAEELGYLWEQDGPAGATASEGGRPITNSVAALRLRLRLRVEGQVLKLKQETTGVMYTGGSNPGIQIRLALQARTVRKATAHALAESGLAA